ncbi:restriction endonuclease subunit S [Gallibacterium anatis]|uniref:Restriction endonuclease subunit S n=1 Tax=Gallibacterium anatis TaxID=750 RepID=A0A930UTP2_9PAST|nr:restriction endonuclease subunit S [Gallibacterium anatis]
MEISIPTLPEQQKIGALFRRLDRLITLHKRQHEHYQLLKKALLQQMFV